MYDASDDKSIRRAQRAAQRQDAANGRVISRLMSDPESRAFVHNLLVRCSIFHTPWTGVASGTDFNCGKQSVGLELIAEVVRWAPDQYIQMMREAQDKEVIDDRHNGSGQQRDQQNGGWDDSALANSAAGSGGGSDDASDDPI